jgi:DNA-binding response OmpR family regulator
MVDSVFSSAPVTSAPHAGEPRVIDPLGHLGTQERAVLIALAEDAGKVVSRRELARRIGIENLSERRCDSILVGVRRVLGPDAIRTVRSRGWMLQPSGRAFLKEHATGT